MMTVIHRLVLYGLLGLLSVSLVVPGVVDILKPGPDESGLVAGTLAAKNHLRAVNGMIAALGIMALWACLDLENSRLLVVALGMVLGVVVMSRLYSILMDGFPGAKTVGYLLVEVVMAGVFIFWPPPRL